MTNTGGTPAGWYHAPGDPDSTQRYWDGGQWIGEPQAVQQQAPAAAPTHDPVPAFGGDDDQTVQYRPPAQSSEQPSSVDAGAGGYGAPGAQPSGGFGAPGAGSNAPPSYNAPGAAGAPPSYGAPGGQPGFQQGGAPAYGAPPQGYQAYSAAGSPGASAEWGTRAVAYLIDIAPIVAVYVVILIAAAVSDTLGVLLLIVGWLAILAYTIWNFYVKQGSTGQTIGKEKQGIKLVKDETGQPVGGLMAFVRYLVVGAFALACGIGSIVNLLSPLWNSDKKTYSDKIMKMSVVKV